MGISQYYSDYVLAVHFPIQNNSVCNLVTVYMISIRGCYTVLLHWFNA